MADAEKMNGVRGDEINLLDLLIVLAKHKKMILRNTIGAAVIALVVSLLLPKIYTATTSVMPPEQNQSAAGVMLGQLGALAGAGGASLGLKNSSDLYIGMLKSRTVEDSLIRRFGLLQVYDEKMMIDARKILEKNGKISSGKDGIITIDFDDKNPKRAADIANAYVDELNKLISTLAITEASQRRLFYEKQLGVVKNNLANAEFNLQKMQERTGLIQVYPQEQEITASNAQLRAEIAAREVQLSAMQIGVTQRNPEYLRLQQELSSLKDRLKNSDATEGTNPAMTEKGLEYIEKFRDVKYNQAVMDLLYKQFEAAKIDEAKDAPLIQIIDKAIVPEKKTKPKRALIVISSAAVSVFLSILWSFIMEAREKAGLDPENIERFVQLRKYGLGK